MADAQRLQFVYKSLPDASIQSRVVNLLLDREVMSAAQSKEQAMEALVAWFAGEVVRLDSSCSERDYSQALAVAIASLESRAAYYRSLLAMSGALVAPVVTAAPAATAPIRAEGLGVATAAAPVAAPEQTTTRVTSDAVGEATPFGSSSAMGHLFDDVEVEE